MKRSDSEESLPPQSRADDRFFVIASVLLPYLAEAAYLFDVFYYHNHQQTSNGYEGLLSSILSVFVYLQYCAPLRSRWLRTFYHTSLWILAQIGTLAHVAYYAKKDDVLHLVLYSIWALVDTIYFICLIFCRVIYQHRGLHVHMPIEQEHLFHFISRLEVILALFIPVFFDARLVTLTRDNIAFYILFDFFSESYHRFSGVAIKAILYVFVITVTASVATEWIHIAKHEVQYEKASLICEIIAACLCYTLIVMQFFPGNFAHTKTRENHRCHRHLKPSTASSIPTINMTDHNTDVVSVNDVDPNKFIAYF